MALNQIVSDFAEAMRQIDAGFPVHAAYQPGIGPHTETQTVKLVMEHLSASSPQRYSSHRLGAPYADGTRQKCDLAIEWEDRQVWAVEVKMLRLMGDNGKLNDNMITHILSPYPEHRSALTDCAKLVSSTLGDRKAILIFGYDYPGWPMDPAIDAFEALARQRVRLSNHVMAAFAGLVHPVHTKGRVLGWEIRPR